MQVTKSSYWAHIEGTHGLSHFSCKRNYRSQKCYWCLLNEQKCTLVWSGIIVQPLIHLMSLHMNPPFITCLWVQSLDDKEIWIFSCISDHFANKSFFIKPTNNQISVILIFEMRHLEGEKSSGILYSYVRDWFLCLL